MEWLILEGFQSSQRVQMEAMAYPGTMTIHRLGIPLTQHLNK